MLRVSGTEAIVNRIDAASTLLLSAIIAAGPLVLLARPDLAPPALPAMLCASAAGLGLHLRHRALLRRERAPVRVEARAARDLRGR